MKTTEHTTLKLTEKSVPENASFSGEERRRIAANALANIKIEGFEPTKEFMGLWNKYAEGKMSGDEFREIVKNIPFAKIHQETRLAQFENAA